jgi:hypothetical protein
MRLVDHLISGVIVLTILIVLCLIGVFFAIYAGYVLLITYLTDRLIRMAKMIGQRIDIHR